MLGTQRSGTTLLCRMLSAHPDLFIQNELNVRKIFSGGKDKHEMLEAISQLVVEEHGRSLDEILEGENKKLWGLKDPELTYHIDSLEHFLPESKFVVIVRDARAVVNSYMDNKWGLGTNAYTGAQRWNKEVNMQIVFLDNHPEKVHLVRYEDLVSNQEFELKRLCGFLDIAFSSEMVSYGRKPTYYHETRENKKTFGDLNPEMMVKWKGDLSKKEVGIVDSVCRETLNKLNYPISENNYLPNNLEILYFNWHQKIIGELQIQYRWRLSMIREYIRKRNIRKIKQS